MKEIAGLQFGWQDYTEKEKIQQCVELILLHWTSLEESTGKKYLLQTNGRNVSLKEFDPLDIPDAE